MAKGTRPRSPAAGADRPRPKPGMLRWPEGEVLLGSLVIVAAVLLAYANSFSGPFVFDDIPNIVANPAIRSLWPPQRLLSPPPDAGIAGRPMVSLSLAINYAISGYRPWSYHALNVLIHVLAALALFGLARRTLLSPTLRVRCAPVATPLAAAVALLWAVHPLQTQAVTYIIQRCESLMGLFFLLTCYCAVRGWESPRGTRWHAAAIVACLAGMATKEVMVAAPFLIFLYDFIFNRRSPRQAWAASPRLYMGLAGALVVLAILTAMTAGRTLHTDKLPVSPVEYARTQPEVLWHYLRLAFWPAPLALDYGWPVAPWTRMWLPALGVLALLAATLWGLARRSAAGYAGAWFFAILAPSSSIVPLQDLAFEHRMYLPLAGVVALVTVGGYTLAARFARRAGRAGGGAAAASAGNGAAPRRPVLDGIGSALGRGLVAVALGLALALGALTHARNRDYRSEVAIWTDTVVKRPENGRAHLSLGVALGQEGRAAEAMQHTREALRLNPTSAKAQVNYGIGLLEQGRAQEAVGYFQRAIELAPGFASAHSNLGIALCQLGRVPEGVTHLRDALRLDPNCVEAHYNLALALRDLGQPEEARYHYREALRIDPRYVAPEGTR